MKLKIQSILFAFLLISGSILSAPLSGVYTIGGTLPSYASFTAAVTDLLAKGVSGPVTFNARAGTYTEAAISITAITGADSVNTVTFQSQSGLNTDVNLQTGITISAASFITLNNLTIGPAGIVINLVGKSNNITLSNNILNGDVVTAFGDDVIQAIGFTGANLVICSNVINNGSEGICLYGTDNSTANIITNAIIKNNIIQNFYGWGITANNQRGTLIEGNTITTAPTSGYGSIPLYIQNIVYPITVIKNKISLTGSISGIAAMYIVNNHPDSLSEGSLIANNMISVQNGSGFELINNDYFSFYYNTIYNISSGTCFSVGGSSTGNVLADNIFYQGSGQAPISGSQPYIASSDYNDIYSTGSSLSSWQTASGLDAHSKSLLPSFVSTTNLNLTNFTPMQFGITIPSIPDDINGDTRSTIPAVGADDNGPPYAADTNMCCSCSVQATFPPVAAFSASPTTICTGDTVLFTAQPGSGISTWKWTLNGATPATSTLQNPTVVYDTAGTYNVTLIVTGTSGSDSLTKTGYITVNAIPTSGVVTASPDSICTGSSTQLTVTGSSGTIQWQSSDTINNYSNINGANSAIYNTPPLTQSVSYRLFVNNGTCADTSAAIGVTVNPTPVPPILTTPDSLICTNDSTRITSSGSYFSYLWNDGDTTNYTWAKSAGGYWVTVSDANGCSAVSSGPTGRVNISVYPIPSVSITVQGDTLSSFGEASYQWYLNGDSITDADNSIYIASQSGNYSVGITDSNGCAALSNSTYVTITGISQLTEDGLLTIYPDPFTNTIFIKENETGAVIQNIKIYDVLGRIMLNNEYNNSAPLILPSDVSALPPGAYYIRVETNQNWYIHSIIKK